MKNRQLKSELLCVRLWGLCTKIEAMGTRFPNHSAFWVGLQNSSNFACEFLATYFILRLVSQYLLLCSDILSLLFTWHFSLCINFTSHHIATLTFWPCNFCVFHVCIMIIFEKFDKRWLLFTHVFSLNLFSFNQVKI